MEDILLRQSAARGAFALVGALSPTYAVRVVKGWDDLNRLLGEFEPQACILDIFDSPPIPIPTLRRLRGKHPGVAMVIASDFSGREMDLYHLGRISVDGVIRMDQRLSSREIVGTVDRAVAGALASNVVGQVAADLPPLAQEAIRWAIEHAESRPQVSQLAAALALSPRGLLRELRTLNLVAPRNLLLWGRLIRASHLLERSAITVEGVAFRLGYATGGALGKAFKRHVRCSPTGLLQRGGLAWTLAAFQQRGLSRHTTAKERWANAGSRRWRIVQGVPKPP